MTYTESIKLAHNQNSLILEIATSNYTQNKYKYEYQLEGFDRTWLPLHSPKIVYTNLDPGHYKLTVREKNDSQTICGERSLHIYIRPPFYANLYAYLLYILILCLVLYAIVRFNTRQAKLKASLEFEKKEKERIKEFGFENGDRLLYLVAMQKTIDGQKRNPGAVYDNPNTDGDPIPAMNQPYSSMYVPLPSIEYLYSGSYQQP